MGLLDSYNNQPNSQDYSGTGLLGLLGALTGSQGIKNANSGLNNWLGQTMNSPAFTLGSGLMAGGVGLNNVGQSIQQAQGQALQRQQVQQSMQMQQMQLLPLLARLHAMGIDPRSLGINLGALGGGQQQQRPQPQPMPTMEPMPPQQPGAMPGGGQTAGYNPPQAAPSGPDLSWLKPPNEGDIENTQIGNIPLRLSQVDTAFSDNPSKSFQDLRTSQQAIWKQKEAPVIAKLDTLTKSDDPVKYMQSDPTLRAAWPVLAAQRGFDPVGDLNPQNVRTAFTFERNALASSVGEPTVAPNVPVKNQTPAVW